MKRVVITGYGNMLEHGFIAASENIFELDPEAQGFPIVGKREEVADLDVAMSNSFGFGGTNCSLVFRRWPN